MRFVRQSTASTTRPIGSGCKYDRRPIGFWGSSSTSDRRLRKCCGPGTSHQRALREGSNSEQEGFMGDGFDRYDQEMRQEGGGGSFVIGLLTGTVLGAGLGM